MDPLSLVGAIAGIVSVVAKATCSLSDLQSRYKISDLKVSLLIGQLSTLKAALSQVKCLVENACLGAQLVDDLSMSLSSLGTIIGALGNQLDQLQTNAENGLSTWAKVSFVWDEQTMRDYLGLLDHQVNALQLLLSALQCRTIFEQCDMLSTRESRQILQLARDETSSMKWLTDADSSSMAGTLQSVGTLDLETVHARFDFDPEVFTSRAYMVASRANMIDAMMGSRRDRISHSIEITDGSQGNTSSDPTGPGQAPRALATVVEVDRDSNSDSEPVPEAVSDLAGGTIAKPHTSPTALVRGRDHDAQLLESVIHTPEASEFYRRPSNHYRRPRLRSWLHLDQKAAAPLRIFEVQVDKPVKILLLGISESGKSTLAKTMRAAHGNIDVGWLKEHSSIIVDNIIWSLQWLLIKSRQNQSEAQIMQQECSWDAAEYSAIIEVFEELADAVDELCPDISSIETLASKARFLWDHPYIRQRFQAPETAGYPGYLPDCAEHFLNSVERIFKDGYIPSLEDVLWADTRTFGESSSGLIVNGRVYQLWDMGGASSQPDKWGYALSQNANVVIFTFDCSCYGQVLNEDGSTNRMKKQLSLWIDVVNSRCFKGAKIIVMLTKEDKLTPEMLRRHPFGDKFTDYNGNPESVDDIINYITGRLEFSVSHSERSVRSGHINIVRLGNILGSLELWEKLLSVQWNSF